jgi:hypothetical protein
VWAQPNNGMRPTRNGAAFVSNHAGRRVMLFFTALKVFDPAGAVGGRIPA